MRVRRRVSIAGLAAVVGVLLAACQPIPPPPAPQPEPAAAYLMDAGHTGVAPGIHGGPPMVRAWHAVGTGAGVPLSDGHSVFVDESFYCGGACTNIWAYDLATGARRWGPVTLTNIATTALGPQGLYVADNGYVVDIDPATGKNRWLAGGVDAGTVPALSVTYGHLYVGRAVFDPATGRRTATLASPPYYYGQFAAVAGAGVYFQNASTVWKDNAVTGKLVWTHPSNVGGGDLSAQPKVVGNLVYLPDQIARPPTFEILNADTGALVGHTPFDPSAVDRGTAYGVTTVSAPDGSQGTQSVVAAATGTGATRWTWTAPTFWTGSGTWAIALRPLVADGVVYTAVSGISNAQPGQYQGELVALDAATGRQLQTIPMDIAPSVDSRETNGLASLALVGNRLLVPTDEGVEAFQLTVR